MDIVINQLASEGKQNTVNMISDIANIRMTVINIRISVAKLDHLEARALDVVADHIEHSLLELEERVKAAGNRYGLILQANKGELE